MPDSKPPVDCPFDTARLDWLAKNPTRVTWGTGRLGKPGAWYYTDKTGTVHEANSLRTAIDRAKEAT